MACIFLLEIWIVIYPRFIFSKISLIKLTGTGKGIALGTFLGTGLSSCQLKNKNQEDKQCIK